MSSPLYDLFRAVVLQPDENRDEHYLNLDKAFLDAEVFVSTNVTEYYFAGTDQEHWHLGKHFPNLAPVYDSFWIETKAPTHIKSSVYGIQPWTVDDTKIYRRPKRWGAWFINIAAESAKQLLTQSYHTFFPGVELALSWIYAITLFTQHENEHRIEPMWTFYLVVNKDDGQLVRNPAADAGSNPYLFGSYSNGDVKDQIKAFELTYGDGPVLSLHTNFEGEHKDAALSVKQMFEVEAVGLLKPLLLALSFMHCRNVVRVPTHPSPPQNKKRTARNLPPFNKFYTLEIRPMQRIIQQAIDEYRGAKGASGIEMALHKVRGHFKTYSDKPLMGHAVGTWFWAEAARGSKKRGTVTKQYEVKP